MATVFKNDRPIGIGRFVAYRAAVLKRDEHKALISEGLSAGCIPLTQIQSFADRTISRAGQ